MSKLGLFGVALVAAIPGGILTVLLVMTFLGNADKLSGMLWAISVPTLLTSVLVTVLPVGVLLFGGKSDTADKDEDIATDDDESLEADASGEEFGEFGEDEEDLVADEGDELTMDGEDDFDDDDASDTLDGEGDDLFMEDDDDFGLEMDEDDDDK